MDQRSTSGKFSQSEHSSGAVQSGSSTPVVTSAEVTHLPVGAGATSREGWHIPGGAQPGDPQATAVNGRGAGVGQGAVTGQSAGALQDTRAGQASRAGQDTRAGQGAGAGTAAMVSGAEGQLPVTPQRMDAGPVDDLGVIQFPEVDWRNRGQSLEQLYLLVLHNVSTTITWYLRRKATKRRGAMATRLTAILLGTAAAITPVAIALAPEQPFWRNLSPLASIFAALAAGALALDKFFGFSSGWMRYITTELELRTKLNSFQLTWMQERLRMSEASLTLDKSLELLNYIRNFALEVDVTVNAETRMWVDEFKGSLADIERSVESQRSTASGVQAPMLSGALKLVIDGATTLDGQCWEAQVGNDPFERHSGDTMVVNHLNPGPVAVRVRGVRNGRPVFNEDIATIRSGECVPLNVKL